MSANSHPKPPASCPPLPRDIAREDELRRNLARQGYDLLPVVAYVIVDRRSGKAVMDDGCNWFDLDGVAEFVYQDDDDLAELEEMVDEESEGDE